MEDKDIDDHIHYLYEHIDHYQYLISIGIELIWWRLVLILVNIVRMKILMWIIYKMEDWREIFYVEYALDDDTEHWIQLRNSYNKSKSNYNFNTYYLNALMSSIHSKMRNL